MGRGRARAKQTRVARDLKYRSVETDFSSLERELQAQAARSAVDDVDEVPDQYADLVAEYSDDEYDEDDEDRRA